MKNIDKIKHMTANELAMFLYHSGYIAFTQENPFCAIDCPCRGEDGKCSYNDEEDAPCLDLTESEMFEVWLNKDTGRPIEAQAEMDERAEYDLCHAQEHKLIADGLRELNKNFETQDKLASLRAKEIIAIRNEQRKLNERYDVLERAIVALTK